MELGFKLTMHMNHYHATYLCSYTAHTICFSIFLDIIKLCKGILIVPLIGDNQKQRKEISCSLVYVWVLLSVWGLIPGLPVGTRYQSYVRLRALHEIHVCLGISSCVL